MRLLILTAACLLFSHAVHAEPMQAGLWEVTSKMKSDDGEMEKAMAQAQAAMKNMPPEQRKMMQEMMAKQGVNMSMGADGSTTVKLCISEEMARRNQLPAQQTGDCKTEMAPRAGNTQSMSYACSKPVSSGTGVYTWNGGSAYTFKMDIVNGSGSQTQKIQITGNGKWLADDCGGIKPISTGQD